MIILSQNLLNYDFQIPKNAVLRINLAWIDDLSTLDIVLDKHKNHNIFLDLPIKRTKPPNNKYTLKELVYFFKKHNNIRYFAISNVESEKDLSEYLSIIPKQVTLVPKIESENGIVNIREIVNSLGLEKVVMLDHDDLYSSLLKSGKGAEDFQTLVKQLVDFSAAGNVTLLRTVGVIFSNDEIRHGDYVN
tara:strand:- start:338 stop:907 length:570 start_codon:yes stop_codon:yes gene_type:complete